jgi:hypothetical protein
MKFFNLDLTQRFGWLGENTTGPLIIPEGLPPMDLADSHWCNLAKYCSGEKHEDFCGNPAWQGVLGDYCIEYKRIEKMLVQGAEILFGNVPPLQINLKERSRFNRILRKDNRGLYFVKNMGAGLN